MKLIYKLFKRTQRAETPKVGRMVRVNYVRYAKIVSKETK